MNEYANKVLLVDIENGLVHIQSLLTELKEYSKIIVCYAHDGVKIPLDWLIPLSEILQTGQLELVKMPAVSKNSADFGLYFLAGVLAERLKQPTDFTILSNDSDMDYLVSLLGSYQHHAKRIGFLPVKTAKIEKNVNKLPDNQKQIASSGSSPESSKAATKKVTGKTSAEQKQFTYKYCQRLSALSKTAKVPATKQSLLQSIRSFTEGDHGLADKTLHYLISSSAYTVKDKTKIEANLSKINDLAKLAS